MEKINLKKYVYKNKIKSTLFIIKETEHGGIKDKTKKAIKQIRHKIGNVRFILLSETLKPVTEAFDLVITDDLADGFEQRVEKLAKFNRLLIIEEDGVKEIKNRWNYKSFEVPLTHVTDVHRVPELKRLRRKQTIKQLAGKKVGLYIGVAIIAFILIFASVFVTTPICQYVPDPIVSLDVENNKSEKLDFNTNYSAISANTGFAAYNQNMHFYMDSPGQMIWGGQGTAESAESVYASLAGFQRILADQAHDTDVIIDSVVEEAKTNELRGSRIYSTSYEEKTTNGITYYSRKPVSDEYVSNINLFNEDLNDAGDGLFDFIALQEQDINCPKSFNTDQPQIIKDTKVELDNTIYKFSDIYGSTFAYNFSTPFIPLPLNNVFGKAVAGLSTFSKYYNANSERIALANVTTFPLNLFEMKRCLSVNWYPIGNEVDPMDQKYFVFINAHLAAYDSGGNIRREQLITLNNLLKTLDEQGHYYMVAADWNQIIPDTRGYEGHDALETLADYPLDNPVMAWDFEEFDSKKGNPTNPDLEKDYIHPAEYDPNKLYKKDDVVSYTYDGEKPITYEDVEPVVTAPGHNGPLTQYMKSTRTHNYQAVINYPTEAPVDEHGNKSTQWRYSLSNSAVYRDASINDMVRDTLLSVSYSDPYETGIEGLDHYYTAKANFYTTHAIPTLRNGGKGYRGESIAAEGHCYKASIDGFLVSRNIQVFMTYGFDTNFKYCDHNPVGITFQLVK